MKAWLYLVLFIATVLGFPLLYAWLIAPYSKASFLPIILVMVVATPILARFLGIALGNRKAGYRGGSALKAATWQTIFYWIITLSITVVLIYFLGGFK
jgi:hypothetical protein